MSRTRCSVTAERAAGAALLSVWLAAAGARAEPANAEPANAGARVEPANAGARVEPASAEPASADVGEYDARRRLGPAESAAKAEGGYFTGLPLINYDSNTGLGLGARGYYYYDGERSDPRFEHTPYLYRVFLQAFLTTGGYQFHWLDIDARHVLDTAWMFRGQFIYQSNTDQHYFGIGAASMRPLSFTGAGRGYRHFDEYQSALDQPDAAGQTRSRYDRYRLIQPLVVLSFERPLLRGLVRPLVGVGLSYNDILDYTGKRVTVEAGGGEVRATQAPTRLAEDCAAGEITGCQGGWNNFLRLGLSFDTRDFEPDPNRGVFIDAALDVGTRLLGSGYGWVRGMLTPRAYLDLLPSATDLVLATRATFVVQSRDVPFFNMGLIPYTEEPRSGLGGLRTLRGYKQDRFVGPVMTLLNAELRWTFGHSQPFGQRFAWMVVPFLDLGAVHDRLGDLSFAGWKRDQGLALRASWNLATIITAEYAFSDEDSGVYVNFNHMF
jgi:surface antigen Omp85-like protein